MRKFPSIYGGFVNDEKPRRKKKHSKKQMSFIDDPKKEYLVRTVDDDSTIANYLLHPDEDHFI